MLSADTVGVDRIHKPCKMPNCTRYVLQNDFKVFPSFCDSSIPPIAWCQSTNRSSMVEGGLVGCGDLSVPFDDSRVR